MTATRVRAPLIAEERRYDRIGPTSPAGSLMRQAAPINVSELIDRSRFGAFQWSVAIWCGVLVTLDGFDNSAINYAAPAIAHEWGIAVASFGPVFGAGLFGLMLGALSSGPLADRFGRKSVILVSTLVFSAFALATTQAQSIEQLYILRFLTGLGVGGLMPNSIALTAEYSPRRLRATVVAIMFLGFPLGAGGGGFVASALIPAFGWQALFVLGGTLPLVLLVVALWRLPESIRFLVARGGRPARVAGLLNRLTATPAFTGAETFVIDEQRLRGFSVRHLLTHGRAANTVLLWIAFFCNLLVLYFLGSWLPAVLNEAGVPLEAALRLAGLQALSGIVSTIILGPIVDRLGAPGIVTALFFGVAVFVFAIGLAGASIPLLALTISGVGACAVGSQSFINVMAASIYPTAIRSTGVGWALGVGRIGAIVGPVVGGFLLAAHFSTTSLFFSAAVPALVASLAMFVLGRRLGPVETSAATLPSGAH
jgi:MFS transporter, AAHS family, 4-hydroxybenzoate transporter